MCHFPIFLCFPECAFSQPSFPNVVDSSLLFPSRSVVADTSFLLAHTSIKRGLFVVDYPRSLPYYTEMCAKIIEWMLKPIQYNWFGGFQPLSMLDTTPGHYTCPGVWGSRPQHRLGGKRWKGWEQYLMGRALEPWERVTGTGSPSTVCVFTAWFCLWVIWNISGISLAVAWRKRV